MTKLHSRFKASQQWSNLPTKLTNISSNYIFKRELKHITYCKIWNVDTVMNVTLSSCRMSLVFCFSHLLSLSLKGDQLCWALAFSGSLPLLFLFLQLLERKVVFLSSNKVLLLLQFESIYSTCRLRASYI
jgi:hypothetical protein